MLACTRCWLFPPELAPPPLQPDWQISYNATRVGEAAVPGPAPLTLSSANVTSVHTHRNVLPTWEGEVIALQETKLSEEAQRVLKREFHREGWQAFWGRPQPQEANRRTKYVGMLNAKKGGVGILVRNDIPARCPPLDNDHRKKLWATGRWLHVAVAYGQAKGSAQQCLHIMSVYGFAGAAGHGHARMQENEQLLSDVLEAAAELGNVPVVVTGDFNVQLEESAALQSAVASGRWVDVAGAQARAINEVPEPTCFMHHCPQGRRIDMVLANTVAAAAMGRLKVHQPQDIVEHRKLSVPIDLEQYGQQVKRVNQPRAFPVEQWGEWDEEKELLVAEKHWESAQGEWSTAAAASDIEAMWTVWNMAAEDYLVERSGDKLGQKGDRGHRGRGELREPKKACATAQQRGHSVGALTVDQRRLLALLRRFEELDRQMRLHARGAGEARGDAGGPGGAPGAAGGEVGGPAAAPGASGGAGGPARVLGAAGGGAGGPKPRIAAGSVPYPTMRLWANIRRSGPLSLPDAPFDEVWSQDSIPGDVVRQGTLDALRETWRQGLNMQRNARVQAWKQWYADSWGKSRGKIYARCSNVTRETFTTLVYREKDGDGVERQRMTGNVEEMDARLKQAWLPIFRRFGSKETGGLGKAEPSWARFRERYRDFIERHPLKLEPITAENLRRGLAKMGSGSAAGMEGWRPRELKALPLPLLEGLAAIFNA
eukprot:gene3443-2025_t